MSTEAHAKANRRVDFLLGPVSVLVGRLDSAKKGLSLAHGTLLCDRVAIETSTHGCGISVLDKLLHLGVVTVLEGDEALGDLEEV